MFGKMMNKGGIIGSFVLLRLVDHPGWGVNNGNC